MNVSRGALRRRLLAMRAWDSQGKSLDDKINEAINQALDRMATDVPEALLPDEEHISLRAPVKTGDDGVKAYIRVCAWDKRLMEFVDADGVPIDDIGSLTNWRPRCTGEWDGIMHLEVKGPDGTWYRRQCREFFYVQGNANTQPPLLGAGTASSLAATLKDETESSGMAVSGTRPLGTGAGNAAATPSFVSRRSDRLLLATRLGVEESQLTDEVVAAYQKQRKNPRNRLVKQSGRVRVAQAMVGNHGTKGGQSYDAVHGVDESLGLVQGSQQTYNKALSTAPIPPPPGSKPGGLTATALAKVAYVDPATVSGSATGAGGFEAVVPPLIPYKAYMVTIERPWRNNTDGWLAGTGAQPLRSTDPMEFRLYQPEFFTRDDVMEVNEPGVIWDGSRQQVWGIDTAGSDRADMRDFRGDVTGRPVRMYRGRHFQMPAPTNAPMLDYSQSVSWSDALGEGLKRGSFKICYTYVWGRRDKEWQQSPNVAPIGHEPITCMQKLWWAHDAGLASLASPYQTGLTGINDPLWESGPSPVGQVVADDPSANSALIIRATNIDEMMGFSNPWTLRFSRTGIRLRFYISYTAYDQASRGATYNAETNDRFYLLCEVEPTYDQLGGHPGTACRFVYTGEQIFDIERPLRHSTGYYAWKTYPAHDQRYEMDFRVTRLPKSLDDDQDTPPIQRGATSALVELAAYYVALLDGADQGGAQLHLDRYDALIKTVRNRYANPGRVVEPTSLVGRTRSRSGRFGTFES